MSLLKSPCDFRVNRAFYAHLTAKYAGSNILVHSYTLLRTQLKFPTPSRNIAQNLGLSTDCEFPLFRNVLQEQRRVSLPPHSVPSKRCRTLHTMCLSRNYSTASKEQIMLEKLPKSICRPCSIQAMPDRGRDSVLIR